MAIDRLTPRLSPTSIQDLGRLRAPVVTHLQVLEEHLLAHEAIDIKVGRQAAQVLLKLIDLSAVLTPEQRSLVHSAVDYFVLSDDDDNDLASPVGLHDDAKLINAVCDAVDRPDLHIDL